MYSYGMEHQDVQYQTGNIMQHPGSLFGLTKNIFNVASYNVNEQHISVLDYNPCLLTKFLSRDRHSNETVDKEQENRCQAW